MDKYGLPNVIQCALPKPRNPKNFDLAVTGIRTHDQKINIHSPNHKTKKKLKKNFFQPCRPRGSNLGPNSLKRTPKWPNISGGPFPRVYNKCLSPRPLTPSQRFDHYVLFNYGHSLTPPNWKKKKKLTLPTPGIEPTTKISPNVHSTTK